MPTISEVATHAGVSMKTVSRVLNGEAHVRPELRDRVQASVRSLGYRPNLAARQLAGSKSFIIGYPFSNPSASYVTEILMGAARACRDRGYHLVSEPVDINGSEIEIIERLITTLRPDGILLIPPLCDMQRVVAHIESLGIPLVRISGGLDLYGQAITIDEQAISRAMVDHLVDQGHRRIGFIMPHPDHSLAQARFRGYLEGLAAAKIEPEADLIRDGRFDVASGVVAAHALFDLGHSPSAIFAANDDMALGVLQVALSRNLNVPNDIAIAGFDDSPASSLVWPPLTTIRQPTQSLGEIAARLLLGEKPDITAVRHELVVRRSTVPRT